MRTCLLGLALALLWASAAQGASIAYVDNGEVWLSSLDGAAKVRLAGPVVNGQGDTEKWLDVAHADNGRIVAVRNKPGRVSQFSWFKVWEPDGTSTVEGPLNAPTDWTTYVYPVGFDLTLDGRHMVYGYSNSRGFYPTEVFQRGTYVRPVTNSALPPIALPGWEHPSLVGNRVIARAGTDAYVQTAAATTYGTDFKDWIRFGTDDLDLYATDVAANGTLAAAALENMNGPQTIGKVEVVSVPGIDADFVFPAAIDCFLPATGVAKEPSLSQDATRIAWTDGGGLKVAGGPTGAGESVCSLSVAPVTISATGSHGAIGGANVAVFAPPAPPVTTGGGATPGVGGGAPVQPAPPATSLASTVKLKATGLDVPLTVSGPGRVTVAATVPAKAMGRKGKPVTIGTGSANATGAGKVTVKLRLTAAAKKRLKKLKGTKLTLTFTQNGRTTTKTVKVR